MSDEDFEVMLTGGHPNSLGKTEEVVEIVLANPDRFEELYNCYQSEDEVVRLRTSSAVKRVELKNRDLVLPYVDRLISEIGELDQASAQWTLARLFERMFDDMDDVQQAGALAIMKRNLEQHTDWIVLNLTMETLFNISQSDKNLLAWLRPQLERHAKDKRKSVSKRAGKYLELIN